MLWRVSWNIFFFERLFFKQNLFIFWKNNEFYFKEKMGRFSNFDNRVNWAIKRNYSAHRFYSCSSSFPFLWRKYCVEYSTLFYLSKALQLIWGTPVFTENSKVWWTLIEKRKPCLVSERLSLQSWHNRLTLYLTLACAKKHISKVFIFHLSFKSELSVCPDCGNLDLVWLGLREKTSCVCVTSCNGECYIVTF